MAVENTVGGVMITGDDIGRYRLVVLKSALKLEIKGMRMHRGRTAYSIIKKEFGFKGDRQRVLDQFETMIQREVNDE